MRFTMPFKTIAGVIAFVVLLLCAASSSAQSHQATSVQRKDTETTQDRQSAAEFAARWGLSEDEYHRYETAMAGLRGRVSDPSITPIEVLGIEARTDADRRKYAEAWVRMIEADTAKVLEFSNAVNDAWG